MADQAPPPVGCYRHPDRPTRIACARCGNPICTECMTPAAVGFQCPDCVHAAAQRTRTPRTVSGAPLIGKPMVTYLLIGLNVAIFLLQWSIGVNEVANDYGMWPVAISLGGEWWRLLTAAFLHGSFLHIAFNMYVLFALGPTLERILGHVRYAVLYVMAAIGGGVASYAFSEVNTVSVGASGAIFGLMAALVVAGKRLRYDITQVLILLGINIVIGFLSPGTDWRAHLGGMVVGGIVAGIMVAPVQRHRLAIQVLGVSAVFVALVVWASWRTAEVQQLLGL